MSTRTRWRAAHELRTLSPVPQGGAVVVCEVACPASGAPRAFAFSCAEEFELVWRSEENTRQINR